MSTLKIVKYYDYIHKRWRYIEVNDEVYRYFDSLKSRERKNAKVGSGCSRNPLWRSAQSKALRRAPFAKTSA